MVYVRDLLCHLYLHHYVVCRMGLERRYDLLKCTQQLVSQAAIRSQCSWLTQQPFLPFRLESEAFNYVLTKVLCVCVLCCVYKLCVLNIYFICFVYIYVGYPQKSCVCLVPSGEGVRSPGTGVTDDFESHVQGRNCTQVLCKSNNFFYPLSYISSPFWEVSKYNFYTFLKAKKPHHCHDTHILLILYKNYGKHK